MVKMVLHFADELTLPEMMAICERFDCTVSAMKSKGYWKIETENPVNFFWLGINFQAAIERLKS